MSLTYVIIIYLCYVRVTSKTELSICVSLSLYTEVIFFFRRGVIIYFAFLLTLLFAYYLFIEAKTFFL